MRWNETIYLMSSTVTADSIRNQKLSHAKRLIYANQRSIRFSAKLAAGIDDYSKIRAFEILTQEYQGEEKLEFAGYEYDILDATPRGDRTYLTAKLLKEA